ncbi:phytanoyl-CoA dioxygenase family protein [Serratia ureilytica]
MCWSRNPARRNRPRHQDIPYYFLDGEQTVSLWIPVDPVREATLRLIAGSHQWPQWVLPLRWKDDGNFYEDVSRYRPVPNPDIEPDMSVLEWEMEPAMQCCSTSAPYTARGVT